jgi:hypothetical protein
MRKIISLLVLVFATSMQSQNTEVQKTIESFFEGFHAKDTIKMKSVCSDKMILQTIIENANGTSIKDEVTRDFYVSMATIPADFIFSEKILNYSIQVDGAIAQVWTPYEFYINGKLSHKGVNAFTLFKESKGAVSEWKIIYVIDTRRK